jgi:hypothetical protein
MRDLVIFLLCCALAAGYWATSQQRAKKRELALQQQLYQLGAPQTMKDSPQRYLLLGEFARGLRSQPDRETYRKLAPLFLASPKEKGPGVSALAFNDELMGRALGKSLELFDAEGAPLTPRLWSLSGDKATPWEKPLFEVASSPTLKGSGSWLLYGDKKRWAAFRLLDGRLHGYISGQEIRIDGETLVSGQKRWSWGQQGLKLVPEP